MPSQNNTAYSILRNNGVVPDIIVRKLAYFASLNDGWSYGKGDAFSQATIQTIQNISACALTHGIDEQDCSPGLSGQILLVLYPHSGEEIEITVAKDNSIQLFEELADGDAVFRNDIGLSDIYAYIGRAPQCLSFASSTSPCSLPEERKRIDFPVTRSLLAETIGVYQYAVQLV